MHIDLLNLAERSYNAVPHPRDEEGVGGRSHCAATESVCIHSWLPEFLPLEYIAFCSRLTTKGNIRLKTKIEQKEGKRGKERGGRVATAF